MRQVRSTVTIAATAVVRSPRALAAPIALLLVGAACSSIQEDTPASSAGAGAGLGGAGGTTLGSASGGGSNASEICGNGLDDDGDGAVDEDCACMPRATQKCYTGPSGKAGVGICAFGSQTCVLVSDSEVGLEGTWGPCEGSVLPQQEQCGDDADSDCDGANDCAECATSGDCSGGDGNSGGAGSSGDSSTGSGDMNDCNYSGTFIGPGPDTGIACMPGDVEYHSSAPAGCEPHQNILYCEGGTYHCVYGSCCTPAGCTTCMQDHCSQIMSPNAACNQAIQDGLEWISQCGPDRSTYFLSLQANCTQGEVNSINTCKLLNCLPACSPW